MFYLQYHYIPLSVPGKTREIIYCYLAEHRRINCFHKLDVFNYSELNAVSLTFVLILKCHILGNYRKSYLIDFVRVCKGRLLLFLMV